MTSNSQRPRDEIAVLHKAIDLLECLVEAPLTAGEISKQIGMAKPTVYRIIRTLQTRGLVAREIDGSRYMLGTAVYALGSAHRAVVVDAGRVAFDGGADAVRADRSAYPALFGP